MYKISIRYKDNSIRPTILDNVITYNSINDTNFIDFTLKNNYLLINKDSILTMSIERLNNG